MKYISSINVLQNKICLGGGLMKLLHRNILKMICYIDFKIDSSSFHKHLGIAQRQLHVQS